MSLLDDIRTDTREALSSTSEYAEAITVTDNVGNNLETTGFFDESYLELDPSTGAKVQSINSRVVLDEDYIVEQMGSNLPDDESSGWTITVRGQLYYMAQIVRRDTITFIDLIKA